MGTRVWQRMNPSDPAPEAPALGLGGLLQSCLQSSANSTDQRGSLNAKGARHSLMFYLELWGPENDQGKKNQVLSNPLAPKGHGVREG